MRRSRKKYRYTILILLLLSISLGYAFLSLDLNITGIAEIENPTWDIHFENVVVKDGSVTSPTPIIDNLKTTVSYSAILNIPGDYYEFTVDVVNAGTIDGMIDEISSTLNNVEISTIPPYLEYSITYDDDVSLDENQILEAGDLETIKVHVAYKKDLTPEDLPEEEQNLDFKLTITYVQADGNANNVNHPTLYNVLKQEAKNNGLAKEYTGAHQDSMNASLSTKAIYHWYAVNDTQGTQVQEKNNVIFAEHCWQMIRTTDTGGVKLLYNGVVENNQCLSTRGIQSNIRGNFSETLSTDSYWYGTDYIFDKETRKYSLSGSLEKVKWSSSTWSGLIGKYTCKSTSEDGTCSMLFYILSYLDSYSAYVFQFTSSSEYQIGEMTYNNYSDSLADVGYMYNVEKRNNNKAFKETRVILKLYTHRSSYWYADSISYDSSTGKYSLVNPYQLDSSTYQQNIIGKYTFGNSTSTYTNTTVKYVTAINGSTYYYIQLESGNNLSYYNYVFKYGSSYTDNGNGTYTINNPVSFEVKDWYTNYENLTGKYICNDAATTTCNVLLFIYNSTNKDIEFLSTSNNYKYAKSFTYENGMYYLDNNAIQIWKINENSEKEKLNNAHYSCFNTSGECSTLAYITSDYPDYPYVQYINLTNGNSIEDEINDMLYSNNVNSKDSLVKSAVDIWFKKFLLDSSNYLEDTVFCNDRTISEYAGWNPNGGSIFSSLLFQENNMNNSLTCNYITDKFSVNNDKAQLIYPVGLITIPEVLLLNNKKILSTSGEYYTMTPRYYGKVFYINGGGTISTSNTYGYYGIKPVISLKPKTRYISGTGTMADPYIVDTIN